MFAEGNAILELNGKTLSCYKREQWKDRETKSNSPYLFPQSNIKQSIFEVISDKYIISCMMQLPLGKKYAKEILRRLEIEEKTPGSSLCEGDLKNIEKEIEKLKKDLAPYGIYKEDKLIDYSLFEEENSKPEKPFSKLIDEFYRNPQEIKSPNLDKIERKLETQVKYLEELKQEEIRLREIGDKLYEKYLEVEEAIKKKQREVDL